MGGTELAVIGFDEPVYGKDVTTVLCNGTEELLRHTGNVEAFMAVVEQIEQDLQLLAEVHNTPKADADRMLEHLRAIVESTAANNMDLAELYMGNVRKVCTLILKGMGRDLIRLDRVYDDVMDSLLDSDFTYIEARRLVAELSLLECRDLGQMLEQIGRSGSPKYRKFLEFLEERGSERTREAAARAKGDLLSATSIPKAKVVRMPSRVRPQPLTRINKSV